MVLIAGLGNPGLKYEKTRHNTGYTVIDELSGRHGIHVDTEKFHALIGKGQIGAEKVVLIKPITFMNLSGESLREVISFYKPDLKSELIVVYDDIDLEVGRLRIRKSGSAGGHNGMKNIIKELGTQEFIRIRIGIGAKPHQWDLVDWVLGRFSEDEQTVMRDAVMRAADALESILSEGADIAMNRFNQ